VDVDHSLTSQVKLRGLANLVSERMIRVYLYLLRIVAPPIQGPLSPLPSRTLPNASGDMFCDGDGAFRGEHFLVMEDSPRRIVSRVRNPTSKRLPTVADAADVRRMHAPWLTLSCLLEAFSAQFPLC